VHMLSRKEPSCRPAVGKIGYRLTADGWVKFIRNQHDAESVNSTDRRQMPWES
jgi:hypothetical protein